MSNMIEFNEVKVMGDIIAMLSESIIDRLLVTDLEELVEMAVNCYVSGYKRALKEIS